MHSYAQTNIQLFNQLRRAGYTKVDLDLVRDAYEFAMVLFSGRFQPSGKSFIAHVVGTASICGSLCLPATVVAAALLHNAYENGDFGDNRTGISTLRRRKIRKALGIEVEKFICEFPRLYWEPRTTQRACEEPEKLDSTERAVLLILFADHLEHLLDGDVLYYNEGVTQFYIDHSKIAAEIADKLGHCEFAEELKNTIRVTEAAKLPVDPTKDGNQRDSFVVVPKSCRRRILATGVHRFMWLTYRPRSIIFRKISFVRRKLSECTKVILLSVSRNLSTWKPRSRPISECLQANSEAFRELFPEDAVLEQLATGFQFTEGPVWIAEERRLLFSDIPANRIYGLAANGGAVTFRAVSGNSNGLTRDHEGRLIACEHGNRRVTRTEADGSIKVLAAQFQGRRLNSPNDVVVKSDGAIYFTDPSYGIKDCEQEQPVQGVYRLSADGVELSLVADGMIRPNGLAFSPDQKKLYIDDSQKRHLRVYNVEEDGSLSEGAVFYDMNTNTAGNPDGMKVDVAGRVYCTGAGGVWVFDAAGKYLGLIATPEKPSNCAWGDDDWRSLYITAVHSVYRVRVMAAGVKVP